VWWSDPDAEVPVLTKRPADPLPAVLAGLGLSPSDGGLWTDAGHTVGVARCAAGIFIGWIDVGWATPGTPVSELRDVTHLVERATFGVLANEIAIAVDEAARARAEHLRDCERCDERFVPGQMYGAACCHSCAVRDGDTVG
jgi:hypothetical protein